jgi:hypothetical protein
VGVALARAGADRLAPPAAVRRRGGHPESNAADAPSSPIEGVSAYTLALPVPFQPPPETVDTGPRKPFSSALRRIAAENRERLEEFEREREERVRREKAWRAALEAQRLRHEHELKQHKDLTSEQRVELIKRQLIELERQRIAHAMHNHVKGDVTWRAAPAESWETALTWQQMLAAASATISDEEATDILMGKRPDEPPPLSDFLETEESHSAKPGQEPT